MDTIKNKNILDLERKISNIQVEADFYNTPFTVTGVEAKSCNHIFGNGKWKKIAIAAFGEDKFNQLCDKYTEGNSTRAVDFKICRLNTPQAKYFLNDQTVDFKDNNSKCSGTYKVVGRDSDGIYIMCPFTGNTNGTVINRTMKDATKNALNKHLQMLQDIKPTVTATKSNMDTIPTTRETTSMIEEEKQDNNANFWASDKEAKQKKIIKIVSITGITLVLLVVAFLLYKKYNSKNK